MNLYYKEICEVFWAGLQVSRRFEKGINERDL